MHSSCTAVWLSCLDSSLSLLYRRQLPGIRADGTAEGPVFPELDRLGVAAADDGAGLSLGPVIQEISPVTKHDQNLSILIPHLGDLALPRREIFPPALVRACGPLAQLLFPG